MAKVIRVVEEEVEVYVNMAHNPSRIIQDTIKSTSFPSVESLHEQDDVAWENLNHNWEVSFILSESAPLTWVGDQANKENGCMPMSQKWLKDGSKKHNKVVH